MSHIVFRRYQAADHDAVWSVFAECTRQLGFSLGPWDDDLHAVEEVYLEPGGEFIVGQFDGEVVAFAGFYRDSADRAEIRRVGVHPAVQGRGFARAMTQELEERARKLGITYLYLDTSIRQTAAQQLYRTCGYREAGHVDKSGYECIVYDKNLVRSESHEAMS